MRLALGTKGEIGQWDRIHGPRHEEAVSVWKSIAVARALQGGRTILVSVGEIEES